MVVSDGTKSSSGEMAAMSELETELALLREENAQLKVERHRPADVGHVIERMRSLRPHALPGESSGSAEVAQAIVVRDGLMDACAEVQQAMQGIRARLSALAGDIHSRPGDREQSERLGAPTVEPSEEAESSSDLARSVA
jgi:glutamine synthetase adenylyltransferase